MKHRPFNTNSLSPSNNPSPLLIRQTRPEYQDLVFGSRLCCDQSLGREVAQSFKNHEGRQLLGGTAVLVVMIGFLDINFRLLRQPSGNRQDSILERSRSFFPRLNNFLQFG
jgi:hypothetical protein